MKVGTFVRWKLDQERIIRTQCVNVNKPERKCAGKCRLSILLKLYDETHTPIGNSKQQEQRIELSWFEVPESISLPCIRLTPFSGSSFCRKVNWKHHPFRHCVFQPPDSQKNV